jgi:hypothetical protein
LTIVIYYDTITIDSLDKYPRKSSFANCLEMERNVVSQPHQNVFTFIADVIESVKIYLNVLIALAPVPLYVTKFLKAENSLWAGFWAFCVLFTVIAVVTLAVQYRK